MMYPIGVPKIEYKKSIEITTFSVFYYVAKPNTIDNAELKIDN